MDALNILEAGQQRALSVLEHVTPDRYREPSPCADWDVKTCANKLVLSNQRFVQGLTGGTFDFGMSNPPDLIGDASPVEVYGEVAAQCASAFAAPGALEANYNTPLGETPGATMLGIRIFDDTAIIWDLAVATGAIHGIGDAQAQIALDVAKIIVPAMENAPDYQRFQAATQARDTASPLEEMLALSGRNVQWPQV